MILYGRQRAKLTVAIQGSQVEYTVAYAISRSVQYFGDLVLCGFRSFLRLCRLGYVVEDFLQQVGVVAASGFEHEFARRSALYGVDLDVAKTINGIHLQFLTSSAMVFLRVVTWAASSLGTVRVSAGLVGA
jgi:hypothetical protein